ncbi:NADH-quinone oxidoreductase subunit C [Amycolatopsis sp. SID8362]|uniref:NADH-quinone oxidoreductase subunit C n=1 Tax=Amycolatopsis sp. SID8362 TaxID=2690346 RepID=UPI00136BCD9D|nr:NADH-quinone oxidoreductase subunit C [Amycolatopsis sp. SID8362]NBH04437.1 NADH-quinone oxidoreductase subunit C [Amycolatopsis sp. SID8362]NED41136.1 NADH-quinone oxidoreductase subunit C [Amycolatopsis sp. SID8362]
MSGERAHGGVAAVRQGMFGVTGAGDTSGYGGLSRTVRFPGPASRPYGGWFDEFADVLAGSGVAAEAVERIVVAHDELTVFVARWHLTAVARVLRDMPALRFELCSGVSGAHYPHDAGRELHAVVHLLSITHNRRVRLEITCPNADPRIPSLVGVYPAADAHERETYDFFGIVFDGHPALTRTHLPDDWSGHPQRKDYPLGGIPVEYTDAAVAPPHERRSYH